MDTDQAVAYLADRLVAKRQGDVAQVKGDTVYIALGEQDGILEGSQFDIVRLGDPIQVGGQLLGHEERVIGKAEAERILEKLTVARMLAKLETPRNGDRAYLARSPVKRLVVAPFTLDGNVTSLGQGIQESLITALLSKGMKVVERSQLEQVLAEQKLGYSGLVKLDSAKKLGELLGADSIVLGSLRDLGETVDVNARLVALESGTGLSAAQTRIAKTQVVAQQLGQLVEQAEAGAAPLPASGEKRTGKKVGENHPRFDNDFVRIEAVSLSSEAQGLLLKLRFTNISKKVVEVRISDYGTCYLADDVGERNMCKEASWKDQRRRDDMELVPDIPRLESIRLESRKGSADDYVFTAQFVEGNQNRFYVVIKGIAIK